MGDMPSWFLLIPVVAIMAKVAREQKIAATARHELRSDQEAVNQQRVEQLAQRLR